ncbi:MAG: DUF1772 domain-containing protein [Kibdelosporangium sp.]
MLLRLAKSLALLSTGLLAGTFAYGAVNLTAAFNGVPLDVRLTFHAELMKTNGPVVQTTMALAALSSVALAILSRGTPRLLAAGAGALAVVSFLVTRFGNVPINGQIKQWAVSTAPADHAEILQRWEMFNVVRTLAGLIAFLAVICAAVVFAQTRRVVPEMSAA